MGAVSCDDDIVLDAYAAIRCPVKVQNHHDSTVRLPEGASAVGMRGSSDLQHELFGGRAFVDRVLAMLAAVPGAVDLRLLAEEDWTVAEAETREAVRTGAPVIIGPRLPVDRQGHRRGSPAVLVRGQDRDDGSPGYVPVQVRARRMLERHHRPGLLRCSPVGRPVPGSSLNVVDARLRTGREEDQLYVAHFWRLLEACQWQAGGEPLAGLVGTDLLTPTTSDYEENVLAMSAPRAGQGTLAIAWVPLTRKQIRTFSRTAPDGWRARSPLERYDHEFSFRVKVAEVARRRTGASDDPRPMVAPIVIRECESCHWWSVCQPALGDDDLSLRINKSPLDVREISVLRSLGVRSVHDLVDADLDALLPRYLPEVMHRPGAEERLKLAARRAHMMAQGVELERTSSDPLNLPDGDFEIDLDIETSSNDRVYLWGFLIRDRSNPLDGGTYRPFVRFEDLDDEREIGLARQAMEWLTQVLADHPDATVFHYSDYEIIHLAKLAGAGHDEVLRQALTATTHRHVDLFTVVRENFFGAHGLSLKVVANKVAGFSWRDDSPGGLNSQRWFVDAVHGADEHAREEARRRVLDYNEDDVRATAALRDWLREQD